MLRTYPGRPASLPVGHRTQGGKSRTTRQLLEAIAPVVRRWRPTASNASIPEEVGGIDATIAVPASVIIREPATPRHAERVQNREANSVITWPSGTLTVGADQSLTILVVAQAEDISGTGIAANVGLFDSGQSGTNGRIASYTVGSTLFGVLADENGNAASASISSSRAKSLDLMLLAYVLDRAADTWRVYLVDDTGTQASSAVDASSIGAITQPLTGLLLDSRSTTGWDGQFWEVDVLDGAATQAQIERFWTDYQTVTPDRRQLVWEVGAGHAGQGLAWDPDRDRWWTSSGTTIYEHDASWTLLETHSLAAELTAEGITSTHLGAICYGGGWLWAVLGVDNSTCWLIRVDPATGALDQAWDLKTTLGANHSSGDPVAYRESDGHLFYSTTAYIHELAIDEAGVVTSPQSWALAGTGYGSPQGLRTVGDDRVLATLDDATAATVDSGVYLIDLSGETPTTVDSWTDGFDLPSSLHLEGIEPSGGDYIMHAEMDRVVEYRLPGLGNYL